MAMRAPRSESADDVKKNATCSRLFLEGKLPIIHQCKLEIISREDRNNPHKLSPPRPQAIFVLLVFLGPI